MGEELVGMVKEYFAKIGVAGIQITAGVLQVGDTVRIKGHTTDFTQQVASMQLEHQAVQRAEPGQVVGVKVKERVRPHDTVLRVTP